MNFAYSELRQAAEREVAIRKRVYPNRIETGRMTRYQAERELNLMRAIALVLRTLEEQERLL